MAGSYVSGIGLSDHIITLAVLLLIFLLLFLCQWFFRINGAEEKTDLQGMEIVADYR